jgi:hypothetical protein
MSIVHIQNFAETSQKCCGSRSTDILAFPVKTGISRRRQRFEDDSVSVDNPTFFPLLAIQFDDNFLQSGRSALF